MKVPFDVSSGTVTGHWVWWARCRAKNYPAAKNDPPPVTLPTYLGLLRILHDRRPALASMVRSTCSNRLALSSARWCPGMGASWL